MSDRQAKINRKSRAAKKTKEVAKRPRGRPTVYTEELAEHILDRLATGEPLARICCEDHIPARRTVHLWRDTVPGFAARFTRAREDWYDSLARGALDIANTPAVGASERWVPDPDRPGEFMLAETRKEDMLGHRKLQIDTRLQLLARWDPRRYGNKQTVEHDVVGNLADELRKARERARQRES